VISAVPAGVPAEIAEIVFTQPPKAGKGTGDLASLESPITSNLVPTCITLLLLSSIALAGTPFKYFCKEIPSL
jgi:hypothetical protein